MTEVYSILNQAAPGENTGAIIGFSVFWGAAFIMILIGFLKKLFRGNVILKKIIFDIIAMVMILFFGIVIAAGAWSEKLDYTEYMEAWESGAYSVEIGEPSGVEVNPTEDDDGNTVYEVSFWLNEKHFDSYFAYGGGYFSKSDLKLITGSDIFEVKYIVDESNDNIILSMSVGERTD